VDSRPVTLVTGRLHFNCSLATAADSTEVRSKKFEVVRPLNAVGATDYFVPLYSPSDGYSIAIFRTARRMEGTSRFFLGRAELAAGTKKHEAANCRLVLSAIDAIAY